MGLVYTTILQDDFNWDYVNKTKKDAIAKIIREFKKQGGGEPEIIAEWYGHIVLDTDKTPVDLDRYKKIILDNCDTAIYWVDSTPYKKEELQ